MPLTKHPLASEYRPEGRHLIETQAPTSPALLPKSCVSAVGTSQPREGQDSPQNSTLTVVLWTSHDFIILLSRPLLGTL